jgi:hypothetical protein
VSETVIIIMQDSIRPDNSMNNDKLSIEALTVKNPPDPKADSNDAY